VGSDFISQSFCDKNKNKNKNNQMSKKDLKKKEKHNCFILYE
jgi:hypothetical protein